MSRLFIIYYLSLSSARISYQEKTLESKALPIVTKVQRSKIQPTYGLLGIITSLGLLSSRSTYCKKHAGFEKSTTRAKNQTGTYCPTHVACTLSFDGFFFPVLLPLILFWSSTNAGTCCLLFCTTLLLTTPVVVWFRAKPTPVSPNSTTWITFSRMMIVSRTKMTVVVAFRKVMIMTSMKIQRAGITVMHMKKNNGFAFFGGENPESWKISCVFAVIRVVFSADHLGTLPAENQTNHNPLNRLWLRSLYF
jgi:hypothetical protein